MRLYYSPNSCALASHIILEEVGADYSLELIDFTKSEQNQADYLKINPKARVPALQTVDGIITETPSILFFLAQSFPSKNLAPLDQPFKLAQAQEFNSYLCSTVHVAHAHVSRGSRWSDDEAAIASRTKKVPGNVGNCFQRIDDISTNFCSWQSDWHSFNEMFFSFWYQRCCKYLLLRTKFSRTRPRRSPICCGNCSKRL